MNVYYHLFIDYLWSTEGASPASLTAGVFPMRLRQSCRVGAGTAVVYDAVY